MVTIRESDLVLECPCGHIWWEKVDLPMDMDAFLDRVRGAERCPKCGQRPRKGSKHPVYLLTGDRRHDAIEKKGWQESQ